MQYQFFESGKTLNRRNDEGDDIQTPVYEILRAYETKDRELAESLIAENFRFTSPLDNGINREKYFELCWPNSEGVEKFDVMSLVTDANKVFVVYEARSKDGKRFRNAEVHTVQDGKLTAVEVYFGWDVPHKIPDGGHQDTIQMS